MTLLLGGSIILEHLCWLEKVSTPIVGRKKLRDPVVHLTRGVWVLGCWFSRLESRQSFQKPEALLDLASLMGGHCFELSG